MKPNSALFACLFCAAACSFAATAPAGSVVLNTSNNVALAIASAPASTTFYFTAGVYRLSSAIVPKLGDTLLGAPGAVLNGSIVLSSWKKSSSGYWYAANGSAAPTSVVGECESGYSRCNYPQDLFVDNVALIQAPSLADLSTGTWFFDYPTHRVYVHDNPTGHRLELSVARFAIQGNASNVTIDGLTVEKFANPAQSGAIEEQFPNGPYSSGWIVENSEMRLNHGYGISLGKAANLLKSYIHRNGQLGVGHGYNNNLVQGNEIAFNNTMHYSSAWEAGGTKFAFTTYLTVDGNYVHDNRGPGLWTDGDNKFTTYSNNRTANNLGPGIQHEISFDAKIFNNLLENDGYSIGRGSDSMWWGAGIFVLNSSNVEIYNNTLTNCMNGIGGLLYNRGISKTYGVTYLLKNLNVHNNTVDAVSGIGAGILRNAYDNSVFTAWNNRFRSNSYSIGTTTNQFDWMNAGLSWKQWQGDGNDTGGTMTRHISILPRNTTPPHKHRPCF
jgi:hypothetical protein